MVYWIILQLPCPGPDNRPTTRKNRGHTATANPTKKKENARTVNQKENTAIRNQSSKVSSSSSSKSVFPPVDSLNCLNRFGSRSPDRVEVPSAITSSDGVPDENVRAVAAAGVVGALALLAVDWA
eukprot:m.531257 g.531257  ORF g.531257 m.531257 type:complete len:125 (-) comp57580_c0_seq1:1519-1893(-)